MVVPTMDNLPRVPDTHGDTVDEKLFSDLYIRTSWFDASIALDQIEKGKARGRRSAVYMRSVFQSYLYNLGCWIQKHAGKVLFVAILVLSTFCVGLKSATNHTAIHQLWIEEGGYLEKELAYTRRALGETDSSTHQLLIQTPKDMEASILHPTALLTHLDVVRKAIAVTVHMYDTTWSLKDMCYSPNIPRFDTHYIEQIFESIIPCAVITPLDCFWEGSKLLGPKYPVVIPGLANRVQWTSLNPLTLLKDIKAQNYQFPFDTLEQYMKRAGISTGYTEKPCLNPKDKQCPDTAPNKLTGQVPDVGAILTGGCYGFAAKYMHWPEELVVGGAVRNRTHHLKSAKALQTVIQLMGERELYDYWNNHYKVHHIGWDPEKAAEVLNAWQKKFSAEVNKIMQTDVKPLSHYGVYAFSSATLDDILGKFSSPDPISLGIGIAIIVCYTALALLRWKDPVNGQSGVGAAGVLVIAVTTAAGLGFCALLGIAFNAATTQVIPFLALGLGVDHIFVLTHAYAARDPSEHTGHVLKKAGMGVLFAGATTAAAFFAATLIPVPALRVFCLQGAILIVFNLASVMLVFPAMISLDLRRRRSGRSDVLCCCLPALPGLTSDASSRQRYHYHQQPQQIQPQQQQQMPNVEAQRPEEDSLIDCPSKSCFSFSISKFAHKHYAPFIAKSSVKVCAMLLLSSILGVSLFASMKLPDGLELTDLVPQNTNEHRFLSVQGKLFGFYSMFAVTQGDFEYPNNQKLLHEYHEAYVRVSHVIKNDNGGLPDFWLSLFRDWLSNLQKAFDRDYREGRITQERWFPNASNDAILAYKLLVQTGHVDNPIDKSLVTQVRLVDSEGVINPPAFYNYLSAWAWNDVLAYGASQGNLRPEPREWVHTPSDFELKIPKSAPLTYTQLPFYLHGLSDTADIKMMISQIRELCSKFEARGLPNYPSGIPFIFWQQYMNLRPCLLKAIGCALVAAFCFVALLLLSVWGAVLIVLSVVSMLIQLLGVMTLLGIKLSAIPAVILIASVGLGVNYSVHVCVGFVTSIGNRDRRVRLALEHAMAPILHGVMTSVLAVCMLSTSSFEFVVRHFFWLLLSTIIISAMNGLFFFPILLSMFGPGAEVIPLQYVNRISTPSPPPKRINKLSSNKPIILNNKRSSCSRNCSKPHHHHKHNNVNLNNEPSLTTITEEPQSWKSSASSIPSIHEKTNYEPSSCQHRNGIYGHPGTHYHHHHHQQAPELQSIVLQPEVTVETHHHGGDHQNTKVTATANIKVELVTPGRARMMHTTTGSTSSNNSTTSSTSSSTSNSGNNSSGSSSS
ncbi:LOW QUALITY PROTEIN: protein patched [Anopheles darlingi]|uniref:LOW QUALITY PROTEIN: protein patched n=1 Tax=Anopheles darlingi TaxID=43151 RepID=UPI0021001A61|nr:LOW QUALITY PROTEIN: protein patched [Anopheles darlingi]